MIKLQQVRHERGLTQAELSARSGVSLRQIQALEAGQRDIKKASAETVYKLSLALCVRVEDLLK